MTESSDLSAQQEAVRRLLAEARHDEPTPPEVIGRLDATLAELAAARGAAVEAPVIDLAARRRRLASFGVLAAATVVVAGVALGQVLSGAGDDAGSSADSNTSALRDGSDDTTAGAPQDEVESLSQSQAKKSYEPQAATLPEVTLDSDLAAHLTDLRADSKSGAFSLQDALVPCEVGDIGNGRQILAQVDGQPGLVLFGPRRDGEQVVKVFFCGNPAPVRTLTLPAS